MKFMDLIIFMGNAMIWGAIGLFILSVVCMVWVLHRARVMTEEELKECAKDNELLRQDNGRKEVTLIILRDYLDRMSIEVLMADQDRKAARGYKDMADRVIKKEPMYTQITERVEE